MYSPSRCRSWIYICLLASLSRHIGIIVLKDTSWCHIISERIMRPACTQIVVLPFTAHNELLSGSLIGKSLMEEEASYMIPSFRTTEMHE